MNMSINYFLYSKSQHEIVNMHLKEIIDIYEKLIENLKTNFKKEEVFNKKEEIKLYETIRDKYEQELIENMQYCDTLKDLSYATCKHNYVTDMIDVSPDKSEYIEYCDICLHTK